jgi:hypothetical protein
MDGGTDDLTNLAAACLHCNQHRGTQKNQSKQKPQREIPNRDTTKHSVVS